MHQERVQQEKLKAVKARLKFEEVSQHSESGTPKMRRDLRKGLAYKRIRSIFESLKQRHITKEEKSRKKNGFKRLENGVFHRLGDKEKGMSAYSNDSRHQSYHSSYRDTKSCYQSSPSKRTEITPKRHHHVVTEGFLEKSIDSYDDLKKAFLERTTSSRRSASKIRSKFTTSSKEMGNPRKNLRNDEGDYNILRREVAASNHERKKSFPSWKQHEAGHKQNFKKGGFQNQQRQRPKKERSLRKGQIAGNPDGIAMGCTFLSEELPDIDSFNDIHPHFDDDPLSGSTTYSVNSLLEEFADELALISYPLDYYDYSACDIESDIREIEFLLFQSKDFDFKDSIDQSVLTHCDDLFVDPTPEMFTDEQPPDYSFLPRFDVYPDDFLEIESDVTFDDDSFDSDEKKIKEATLLIDPFDLPCDILSEYDSFNSQDFSRDDVLFSPDNEDKKLAVSFASWLFEDFDPPFYELLVFKEVPTLMRLLPFSSENEEKVFKLEIYTFKKFHCCFLSELSHPGFPVFKVNLIFLS
uniref:Reverse transcriptase domain-containing protein n=1 Tax=Tanacetum cinerariifolium TaxID=118510 RepID=A0A699HLB6_TANCI|nr:hypothetical protein [Tanacetum cinerariifolium]